jgi:hypothetical protein
MAEEPTFAIDRRPERRFPAGGGVEYETGPVFRLVPEDDPGDPAALAEAVLADGPYRYGDFHDFPMAVWLVRDGEAGSVFRVSVRGGAVRLHVLPGTESESLRSFYRRLAGASDVDWRVEDA